jgi:hypothetical protein
VVLTGLLAREFGRDLAAQLLAPYLAVVWVVGLLRLWRDQALRWCRAFGAACVVLAAAFLVTGGRPCYLGGVFPLLLAAGAGPAAAWMRRGRARPRTGLIGLAALLSLTAVPFTLPVVPAADLRHTPIVALNYDAGETIGRPAYVLEIAAVYATVPSAQHSSSVVLASNYG